MKRLLWLDDKRNPLEERWIAYSPIEYPFIIIWIKSYTDFIKWITENGLPDGICFDHDLGKFKNEEEKTGYDCAKWLVNYCIDNKLTIPSYAIQSANPIGRENIDGLFKSFIKHTKK